MRLRTHRHPLPTPGELRKLNLRGVLSVSWLAGIPLVGSLIVIIANAATPGLANVLVGALIVCSVLVVLKFLPKGLVPGHIARFTLVMAFVIWYSYPALTDLLEPQQNLTGDLPLPIDAQTAIWSVAYLSLFLFVGLITMSLCSPHRQQFTPSDQVGQRTDTRKVISLALLGCTVGMVPYFMLGGGSVEVIEAILGGRSAAKPWLQSENLGNSTSAFTYLTSSAMIGGVCLLWAGLMDRSIRVRWRVLLGILAVLVSTLVYFDQGTRSIFALIVLPPLLLALTRLWQRSRGGAVLAVVASAIVIFFLLQFQLLYRLETTRTNMSDQFFEDWMTLGGTIDYFRETLLAVRLVPTYHDYFKESVLMQFFVSPIPRFLWQEKPASILVWFYTLWRWNIDIYGAGQSGNVFPGIVGQYYMSWGPFGPALVGALLGWMAVRIDGLFKGAHLRGDIYRSTLGAMLLVWMFLSFRILSPGFFYPILVAMLILQLSRSRPTTRQRKAPSARSYQFSRQASMRRSRAQLENLWYPEFPHHK